MNGHLSIIKLLELNGADFQLKISNSHPNPQCRNVNIIYLTNNLEIQNYLRKFFN